MSLLNTKERYGSISIALHWLMVLLLVAVYACAELREFFPKGTEMRKDLMTWHFFLGMTVFLLVSIRLINWVINHFFAEEPLIVPDPVQWQKKAAKSAHFILYAFMIAMPILGYWGVSSAGKELSYFGIALPNLITIDKLFAKTILETHKTIANIGYFLVSLHVLGALFHHYIYRDNLIERMLFKRTPQKSVE